MFCKDSLFTLLAEQTNLYSMQKSCKSIQTTKNEIEQFIGIQMFMSIVKLPAYYMYWSIETRYPPIANLMSLSRYKTLRQFLHVVDNSKCNDPENKGNKLYKISPVLEHVPDNCVLIEPEIENSIDEQIIPAKTRFSGIRQYNPKKPVKWGFKNFVRSGASGIMYDFFLYTGSTTSKTEKCNGSYVVNRLIECLPKHDNFKLFFDNWFCSLDLCRNLRSMGILTIATIRADRMHGCLLPTEKELKKGGRGSHSFKSDANSGIIVTRWYDNKCVNLCSTYTNPNDVSDIRRWDRIKKEYIEISCPNVVKEYNKSMGGVDLSDMLISLYRTNIKSKRWYLKVLFHCIDIAKVNGWLLYRRHCTQLRKPKISQLTLLKFTSQIASGLAYAGKVPASVGRPKRKSTGTVTPPRKLSNPLPCGDARFDGIHHWPEYREKKLNCRACKVGNSRVYCKKCNICLCLSNIRNCFYDFHTK